MLFPHHRPDLEIQTDSIEWHRNQDPEFCRQRRIPAFGQDLTGLKQPQPRLLLREAGKQTGHPLESSYAQQATFEGAGAEQRHDGPPRVARSRILLLRLVQRRLRQSVDRNDWLGMLSGRRPVEALG